LKTFKIITLLFITILSSCVKEDVDNEIVVEPVKTSNLAISSIFPTSGPKDTTVSITGVDFSPNVTSNKVTINGMECSINEASSNILNVTIPRGAGTGNIVVTVGGNTQQGPVFTYLITPSVVTTLAGSGEGAFSDGVGTGAKFNDLQGITVDSKGNIYIGDSANYRIRKVTSTGTVTTLAGNGEFDFLDATGIDAKFRYMVGVAVDKNENVYVADFDNHKIRKITSTGVVTTLAGGEKGFADGQGEKAQFENPVGVAVDKDGNVYVSDMGNSKIRKINASGKVTTLAGSTQGYLDSIGTKAQFSKPFGIAVDIDGNVYIGDNLNNCIRKITSDGVVTTLAGSNIEGNYADGIGSKARFNAPRGVAVDTKGNVYVADFSNNRIRKVTPTGVVTTLAGTGDFDYADGIGSIAKFRFPTGIAVDDNGNIFVADHKNNMVRKITQD
jgi:sugar lactone lactonase YvrE